MLESAAALRDHSRGFQVLAVDIPIGLMDDGPRECDLAARALLGPRRNSVFPAPVRAVLDAADYADACARSLAACGKRLSQQAWAIVPRIRDIDSVIRSDPAFRPVIREVHPEVSFCVWNGKKPMTHPKKSGLGFVERLKLTEQCFSQLFQKVRADVSVREAADDDILDALAALWTAERVRDGQAITLPPAPPRDRFGLPMEMVA